MVVALVELLQNQASSAERCITYQSLKTRTFKTMDIETKHPLAGKKIIVSGAGIGGLAFAIALHKKWSSTAAATTPAPSITIYEREEESQSHREGHALSLRADPLSGGVQALQRMGLLDEVLDVSITGRRPEQGGFCFWDKDWRLLMKIASELWMGCRLPTSGSRGGS